MNSRSPPHRPYPGLNTSGRHRKSTRGWGRWRRPRGGQNREVQDLPGREGRGHPFPPGAVVWSPSGAGVSCPCSCLCSLCRACSSCRQPSGHVRPLDAPSRPAPAGFHAANGPRLGGFPYGGLRLAADYSCHLRGPALCLVCGLNPGGPLVRSADYSCRLRGPALCRVCGPNPDGPLVRSADYSCRLRGPALCRVCDPNPDGPLVRSAAQDGRLCRNGRAGSRGRNGGRSYPAGGERLGGWNRGACRRKGRP